jgi:hypothetical protein
MELRNKIIVGGLACIVLCGLFPPWINVLDVPYHAHSKTPAGYALIILPPESKGGSWGVQIDTGRLFIEWICIAAIAGIVLVMNDKPQKPFIPKSNSQN